MFTKLAIRFRTEQMTVKAQSTSLNHERSSNIRRVRHQGRYGSAARVYNTVSKRNGS